MNHKGAQSLHQSPRSQSQPSISETLSNRIKYHLSLYEKFLPTEKVS